MRRPGADIVAPSDMMDGRVAAIRQALDAGRAFPTRPFFLTRRNSPRLITGRFATRRSPRRSSATGALTKWTAANALEALREVAMDIQEGADMVMVKPALAYLDILHRVKTEFGYPDGGLRGERGICHDQGRRRQGLD